MIDIKDKRLCCGCTACSSICPIKCIEMKEDNEGFQYPYVNIEKCINCGLCENVCPFINDGIEKYPLNAIGARNLDESIQRDSTSGGVFYELAKYIIQNNGIVFGAAIIKGVVQHINVTDMEGVKALQGSKYVQSNIGDSYINAMDLLMKGRYVLFSGTPCQVHGLNNMLKLKKINTEKLLLVETVCRSIPNPKVLKMYINKVEQLHQSRVVDFKFRNKVYAWDDPSVLIKFESGENLIEKTYNNIYMKLFYNDLISRPSCELCKSKKNCSNADITLGDFWTVKKRCPSLYNKNGVSLVLINSQKGISFLNYVKETLFTKSISVDEILEDSIYLTQSYLPNKKRNKFIEDLTEDNFAKITKKHTHTNRSFRKIRGIINVLRK